MSNKLYIDVVEFKTVKGISYGYTIEDDYSKSYDKDFESLEKAQEYVCKENILEILEYNDFEVGSDLYSCIFLNGENLGDLNDIFPEE